MSLYKGLLQDGFKLPECEKHFHDHDETWLILQGRGTGYWIDHQGQQQNFELEAGDVWMIPAGYEHGSEGLPENGRNSDDFTIAVCDGTMPPGCHAKGHYYVEKEGYIPSFELQKTPTQRYLEPLDLPKRMQGFEFAALGQAAIVELDTPVCPPGGVLCQTLYSGLTNGTERNVMMAGNYGGDFPQATGYQNVGRVLAVAPGVEGYAVGDLLFSGEHLHHRQYFATPAADDSLVVKLPPAVEPHQAALFGVASVALHDVRRAQVALGEQVLVVGAGPVGQFTSQIARLAGGVVTVCDLDQERLQLAAELGAHRTLVPDEDWANIGAVGPFDCIIEDSGADILDRLLAVYPPGRLLVPQGRLVIIAGRERVDYRFNWGQAAELTLLQASHFNADDLRHVCRLTEEGGLQVGPLIRDIVPYTEMQGIYERLRDQPSSLLGAAFDWTV
ncbi:MAG: zinc-binding dehydrogenase [Candidatus Latescibacteria bacterium]|nr:zinc-binding dehydrogenase [Candidatus Latescibacterota bacterium]